MTGPVDAQRPVLRTPPHAVREDDERSPLSGAVEWTKDHLPQIASAVTWTALAVQVPMARRAPGAAAAKTIRTRLAAKLEQNVAGSVAVATARGGRELTKRSIRAIPGERPLESGAVRGWTALRAARMRIGETHLGRAALRLQMPVYVASGTIGAAMLAQDAQAWSRGEGSIKDTALHALMTLPVASEIAARAAKAKALSTEVAATERSADQLAEAEHVVRTARTAADRSDAPAALVSALDRTGVELAYASRSATQGADIAASHAKFVGAGSAVPAKVDQTLQVGLVRDRIAHVVQRVDDTAALADDVALSPAIRRSLDASRTMTDGAHQTLQSGWRSAAKSWEAARGAKTIEDVSLKGAYAAFMANNADLVARSATQGHDDDAQSAAVRFGRIAALALLIRNEKGGLPSSS